MPGPDITADLGAIASARGQLADRQRDIEDLRIRRARLVERHQALLAVGDVTAAARVVSDVEEADTRLAGIRVERGDLLGRVDDLSNDLAGRLSPEILTATLDGAHPVAMLPVRIETRFDGPTRLRVRVFPDQLHLDAHDPALTADELAAGQWYWQQRWSTDSDDDEVVRAAWRGLTERFRPGRAAYIVQALTPSGTRPSADPQFPEVPLRQSTWSRAAVAAALPDRYCVVGLDEVEGVWVERFRRWGQRLPDELAVGPAPDSLAKAETEGGLPVDEATRWLREPIVARDQGALIEVEDPSLADGVQRLVVLGVDWTLSPDAAATALDRLLDAQRWSGHLGFVGQGTPTNNTSEGRAGFTSSPAAEAAALDPAAATATPTPGSAGRRLAGSLGLAPERFDGVSGAASREHEWATALVDVLWRATAGFYLSDMLDPLVKDDPQVDADLRDFATRHLYAAGPLPVLRAGTQPYGVLPVVPTRSYSPVSRAEQLVHRVATVMRDIVTPAISGVPHLRRAGESQDVDAVLLRLLQRTPVPWTFRFRSVTGPVERKNTSVHWDRVNAWQRTWTSAMWVGLGTFTVTRLTELTHGKDHPLPVPLVLRPGDDPAVAPGYLKEIAELLSHEHGHLALNLRENSIALLEALAACSGVQELQRSALATVRDALQLDQGALSALKALSRLAVPTPDMVRVEAPPVAAATALDFRSGRQLADTVVPQVSAKPLGQVVTGALADRLGDLAALLGAPTDPLHWLARQREGLVTLSAAPPHELEWAFRGYLDLFSTRLDAWFTGLATSRLADHRGRSPRGVHIGCWGVVEDLRHDRGEAAESLGFVHTPSLAHAASTALLRNGRLANRGDDGAVFDLQVTSDRVRRARWLLEGVAQGQRLAALLGYRLERGLRESALTMMRYQMPMRRVAPLRDLNRPVDEPVEVLAARDVVDGVALLDRWRVDAEAVLSEIIAKAQETGGPPGTSDRNNLRKVIEAVHDSYDAVSDLLVAESVHQAAVGNLDRSGAALAAHDRHGSVSELDYVGSPRSGHTVAHRVVLALQDEALVAGWPRDPRGAAEPRLDAWVSRLLGPPSAWSFGAVLTAGDGTETVLSPVTLADLRLGPLSVMLAVQQPGAGGPNELHQRLGLLFAAQVAADPTARLDLLVEAPAGQTGGLGLLTTLGEWVARLTGASALSAGDLVSTEDIGPGSAASTQNPGTLDVDDLVDRVSAAREALDDALAALQSANTVDEWTAALLRCVAFDGVDALPEVPGNHASAAVLLAAQAEAVQARLAARVAAVAEASGEPPLAGDQQRAGQLVAVLKKVVGSGQPVLPLWRLHDPAPVSASLADRDALLDGDPTAPATWLQRSALVRPELDGFAGLMTHAELDGVDVPGSLQVVQQPHRPGASWLALPFDEVPPHGSLGLVVQSWDAFEPDKPFAGLVVDGWSETIPAETETTAVTFHYDAPGARAPQAVLLAVHPERDPDTWTFDLLLETVNEAMDLARLRTLSSAELAPMGSFLPALYLPDDYTHDVPSVPIKGLLDNAKAAGVIHALSDVLGKA